VRKQTAPGIYKPICAAVVQIFQVDLGCTLDRLASFTDEAQWSSLFVDVLRGLDRATLSERLRAIPNLPDPPPDGFHETHVLRGGVKTAAARLGGSAEEARAAHPASGLEAAPVAAVRDGFSDLASSLRLASPPAIREAILANKAILGRYLCWLIPDEWFCWQELGEATVQSDGTFSAEVCFWCPDDFPDLYFEVVQTVDGIEREISDPQIACSTYYGYDGTRDVVITVTDPTAVACSDPTTPPIDTGRYYVWPQAIGNADLRGIVGLEAAPASGQGKLGSAPWGGTLALKMEFDTRLKNDGVAQYYRWSYRFDGDVDWSPINAPVTHRYHTITYVPHIQIHTHSVNLGPRPPIGGEQNLFEIPDPFPGLGWIQINDPWDVPFAYFDSTDNHLPPFTHTDAAPRRTGMCTLRLELFDAAGHLVPCGNNGVGGPFDFVLPDLSGPPTEYTSVLGPHNITPEGRLVFRVLVDNLDTYAKVDSIRASGHTADACGILHYATGGDNVEIAFHATHPNDYLTWALQVWRGADGLIESTSGGTSSPPGPGTPFTRTAAALLGPHCTNAAFAANLWTYATATDGYARQGQYDRFDSHPFALLTP
jgi:hypothetical protein